MEEGGFDQKTALFLSVDEDSKEKQAWITALRLLAATPKTRKEMAQKLADRGYAPNVVQQTLQQLEKQNILDDRVYAANLLQRFRFMQPSGCGKMRFEMKRHGISSEIQEELMGDWTKEEEFNRAKEAAQGRWERLSQLSPEKRTKKVYDFLARRGFDFQICREVTAALGRIDED